MKKNVFKRGKNMTSGGYQFNFCLANFKMLKDEQL